MKLTNILHDLDKMHFDSLASDEARTIVAYGTGRSTKVPPKIAPYDFGINATWYETDAANFPVLTSDYYKHGDPVGFGSKAGSNGRTGNGNGNCATNIHEGGGNPGVGDGGDGYDSEGNPIEDDN